MSEKKKETKVVEKTEDKEKKEGLGLLEEVSFSAMLNYLRYYLYSALTSLFRHLLLSPFPSPPSITVRLCNAITA